MKIVTLRLSNFQSFGQEPTEIKLTDLMYVLGPNGAGKTAVLEALSRLFSPVPSQRSIRMGDFHVPVEDADGAYVEEPPTLWIEVDIEFPESGDDGQHASVPPNFAHMRLTTETGPPQVRVRLTAVQAPDGVIEEKIEYVLSVDDSGNPETTEPMSRHDRGLIEVHYLPARRDPSDHIAYTASSVIGRTLRAADWTVERDRLTTLSETITEALTANGAVESIGIRLSNEWKGLHNGTFFADPAIAFGRGELESVLRQITIKFSPSHDGASLPFERLSDGQKSLLYISLVLSWQRLASRVLARDEPSLDPDRLRPPVHTVIALEEPENSLAPQYLGRIIRQLRNASSEGNVQALLATHSSTLLRRVDPGTICFLRLNVHRETTVQRVVLPEDDEEAMKYVQEAVYAYPELYFARFVVLVEGASEQVVIPRVLAAAGIAEDDASVSVVPLGGRHVNHFLRLLNELQIPYVTLLDLDSGRYQAGWGRVRYAIKQLNKMAPGTISDCKVDSLPNWDSDVDFPVFQDLDHVDCKGPIFGLEGYGVFFSNPIDLDLMMLEAFPDAYGICRREPDEQTIRAVLGKNHTNEQHLDTHVIELFDDYHSKFNLKSKPASHLAAMSMINDLDLILGMPEVLSRLVENVKTRVRELPE